jgi:hypothetical protein
MGYGDFLAGCHGDGFGQQYELLSCFQLGFSYSVIPVVNTFNRMNFLWKLVAPSAG